MKTEENVMRLAKPKKKGLLRLIFSRFFVMFILILLQAGLLIVPYIWLRDYFAYWHLVRALIVIVMVIGLFNYNMDYSAKLTWFLIISISPVAGSIFFAYTMSDMGHNRMKKNAAKMINETKELIVQDPSVFSLENTSFKNLSHYIASSGCFPVSQGNEVKFFSLGDDAFPVMLHELEEAKSFIFLEYFIIEEGYMWGRILDILTRKAAQGVDVRVLYDGMCEITTLPADYSKLLQKVGIKAAPFAPAMPFLSTHYNNRDHRKIMVIDGKTAFNGGINLADEYINQKVKYGHWKDTAVMVKGPAVKNYTLMFLQMWNAGLENPDFSEVNVDGGSYPQETGLVMPYADCPLDEIKVGEAVYIDTLYNAKKYVHIMTPYLILDGELEAAIKYAAARGVDVKLILPGIPDKKAAYALAKSHYKSLLDAGVRIYEYDPGFVHAKVMVSDGEKAVVGTINMDYRSLYHHFECATYLYKTSCVKEIAQDFVKTQEKCTEITQENLKERLKGFRFLGAIIKLVAPLL